MDRPVTQRHQDARNGRHRPGTRLRRVLLVLMLTILSGLTSTAQPPPAQPPPAQPVAGQPVAGQPVAGQPGTGRPIQGQAQAPRVGRPIVYVLPVTGVIDLGLAPFLKRVLDDATTAGAAAVVLDINTLGGRVDAAIQIRDTLLDARVPTIAFINRRAISAGALIALASEKIAMADGATIGAATPVEIGAPGAPAQPVQEKTVSYLRKEFRSTAEARNRPPLLAEAMVDADVEIDGLITKGKLLTLTTDEAQQQKLVDVRANNLDAVLAAVGIVNPELRRTVPTWAEELVRFLTHPTVGPILIMIGIIGVITEIRTPGFGLPGAVGIGAIGLFFWGHWLVQLAGWEELLLVISGILLLIAEVFLIPGFGVAGVLGIGALLGGFALSLVGTGATSEAMLRAAGQVIVVLLIAIAATLALLRFLPGTRFGRQFILEGAMSAQAGYESTPLEDRHWLGQLGTATSTLRPAGVADLDGSRVDVVSDGEFIEHGEPIVVTRVDGNRIVVRRAHAGDELRRAHAADEPRREHAEEDPRTARAGDDAAGTHRAPSATPPGG